MNCDRIAGVYRWIEYLAFGGELERRRLRYLPEVVAARRALVLGDGDGRFLAAFTRLSQASVDCVDSSSRMLDLARHRVGADRARFSCADALTLPLAPSSYDLIVTHFFLDCFGEDDLNRLIDRITRASLPGALWLISEFRQPVWARPLLAAMYLFFRATTRLENRSLVDHHPLLRQRGYRLLHEEVSRGGLIASELWRLE